VQEVESAHVGQTRAKHDQIKSGVTKHDKGVGAAAARRDGVVGALQVTADEQGRVGIVLDHEQTQRFAHD
jgi:hypothetical protein